jgi:hemerythrin-like domain-containing protein
MHHDDLGPVLRFVRPCEQRHQEFPPSPETSLPIVKAGIHAEREHAPLDHPDSGAFSMTISEFLGDDHAACDDAFSAAENAVATGDWAQVRGRFDRFLASMRRHFAREEEVLFPAFEARAGMSDGPTFVMRGEHQQMNGLLAEMDAALDRSDEQAYLGLSETLLMLMRQHNMKEENILYPMADRALATERADLVARMEPM